MTDWTRTWHACRFVPGLDKGKGLYFLFIKSETKTPGGLPARPVLTSYYKSDNFKYRPFDAYQVYTSPTPAILCTDSFQSMYSQMLCGLLVRTEDLGVIGDADDLADQTVVVQSGSLQELFAFEQVPAYKELKRVSATTDGFLMVQENKADACITAIATAELYLEANRWELTHGGLSGRTAAQFITYLRGKAPVQESI